MPYTLDSGSQLNFVTEQLAKRLKLPTIKINTSITGISEGTVNAYKQVSTALKSVHNSFKKTLSFLVLNKITASLPAESFDMRKLNLPDKLTLADPRFYSCREVDVLLAAGIFFDLMRAGQISLGNGKLVLQKSVLGWLVSGQLSASDTNLNARNVLSCHAMCLDNEEVQDRLEKFWSIEECGQDRFYSKEEVECEELFRKTVKQESSGRFLVRLPLKESVKMLGESLEIATKRFLNLEIKLSKNTLIKFLKNKLNN